MFVHLIFAMSNRFISTFINMLNKPVKGTTLYLFRILFGIISAWQLYIFWDIVPKYHPLPYHITYDFFHWVKPLGIQQANIVYPALMGFALLMAAGMFYRLSAAVVFIGLSYSFLVDKTIYNNHYYLFILIAFLSIFNSAGKGLTLLKPRHNPYIKQGNLFVLRWQLCMVYLFGAINKLNPDWLLHAQPVYAWLPDMLGAWVKDIPQSRRLLISFIICYSGLILDGIAGVLLLLETKWKYWFIPILLIFHLFNDQLFNIGLFPWFSMCSIILFIAPDKFEAAILKIKHWIGVKPANGNKTTEPVSAVIAPGKLLTGAVVVWCLFQLLFPLRHWLIPGYYMWDERGMLFSWTMKLRDKEPIISIALQKEGSNEMYYLQPGKFVNKRQLKYLAYRPLDMVRFAKFLSKHYEPELQGKVSVYAEVFISLNNYRPYQLMLNPYVDLASVELKSPLYTGGYSFIVPLGEDKFGIQPPKEIMEMRNK